MIADIRHANLDQLQRALGHRFADPRLLEEALVHPSANPRRSRSKSARQKNAEAAPPIRDYNRLEFIGDRVLGLVVATLLAERFPQAEAGDLALRYNALVKQESLARFAQSLGLGDFIQLSRSERDSGGAGKPAILADACEAVVAALYLDGGLKVAESFVRRYMEPLLGDFAAGATKDAKTALQEWAAARGLAAPRYDVVSQEGPPHEPRFTVSVRLGDGEPEIGQGGSKRAAEQEAAGRLLARLQRAKS
ncbi:MAG TPA: ribonuclease III [Ferrovibrio sp.]|uniref:ribonuclease III n=1 Tax=Ferrovibrio sp. TaxID=1917215 RepID=UPI002ED5FC02